MRAAPSDGHELGQLTDAFNHMLTEIQTQHAQAQQPARAACICCSTSRARSASGRTCRASSAWCCRASRTACRSISAACACTSAMGRRCSPWRRRPARPSIRVGQLELAEQAQCADRHERPVALRGRPARLRARCAASSSSRSRSASRAAGLHSLVIAPLLVENRVFGVLIAARRAARRLQSADCEFLRQLSEHVALAAHQAQLYGALQQAYDDLRQTQHTVMQQERLRALGQMASGIAHDINNAISPVALYTESLLEREPNLSDRARGYLTTIQRAIDDVAATVARMREFYRQREPQLRARAASTSTASCSRSSI